MEHVAIELGGRESMTQSKLALVVWGPRPTVPPFVRGVRGAYPRVRPSPRNLDGALTSVVLPDGTSVVPAYEPATGRLASVATAHGTVGVGYDPQGRVSAVSTAEESLGYGYDGFTSVCPQTIGGTPDST